MMTRPPSKPRPDYRVPALDRGLAVLEILGRDGRPASVAELARRLDLPRASVFRILHTLRARGFVEADASGKAYTLGPGVLRLGYQFLAHRDVAQVARGELEDLARRTGVSAHLAVRDGRDIVYLAHAPGQGDFVSNLGVGDRLPAHATPMGQLLLSGLAPEDLSALYRDSPLPALTDQTPRSRRELFRVVAEAASRGHVISHGAVHPGGKSVAAPVLDAAGGVVAAIDVSGPDQAFALDQVETRYVKEVVATALRISSRMGFTGRTLVRPAPRGG